MNNEETLRGMARICAASRIPVFPIYNIEIEHGKCQCSCHEGANCRSPGKHPLWSNWQNNATIDLAVVDDVWINRAWNIGIVTGAPSRLVVVDIDPDHGGDETLAQLERAHGPLPPTPRFLTGGGGEHILFVHPGVRIANSAGKLGPGVDIRGDGGYIVAPPSTHISGRRYAINVDYHPEDVPFAPLPPWLIAAVGARRSDTAESLAPSAIVRDWSGFGRRMIGEGQRNSELARLTGLLLQTVAYKPENVELALELVFSWNKTHCTPPLDDAEVADIINSIAGRQAAQIESAHHA